MCRWWQMERATGVLRASYMSRAVRRRATGASLRGAGTALMAASASSAGRVRTAAYAWMSWCTAARHDGDAAVTDISEERRERARAPGGSELSEAEMGGEEGWVAGGGLEAADGGLSAVEGDVALAEEVVEGPVVRRRDEVVEGRDGLVVGVVLEVAEEGAVDDVLGGGSSPP